MESVKKPLDIVAVFTSIPGCHLVLLPDAPSFTIVAATDAYLAATYCKRHEIIGRGVFEALTDNPKNLQATGVDHLSASLHQVLEHKRAHAMADQRYDIFNPATKQFELHVWSPLIKPVLNDVGEVEYIIYTVEDITEKVRFQEETRIADLKPGETENTFNHVIEQASNPICIFRGADMVLEKANQALLHIWNLNRSVIGQPLLEIHPQAKIKGFYELLQKVYCSGESEHGMEVPALFYGADSSSTVYFSCTCQAMRNSTGAVTGVLMMAHEVTAQVYAHSAIKKAQAEAEKQKRLYEVIAGSTPDLIYVFDRNYLFTYANEALLTMWGKSWNEAIGQGLLALGYEPWHAQMHEREIDQVVATKQPIRGEVAFPHASLGKRIYDYIFVPVINEMGEVEAVAGTTRDITEIKEAEETLRKSEQRQRFLLRLNDHLKTLADPVAIQNDAASLVGKYLGADRVGYAEDAGDGKTVMVTTDYTDGVYSLKGKYNYDDYGPALLQAFREGQTVVRSNIADDPSLSNKEKAAHAALQLGATVNVPLLKDGALIAIFFMQFREAHHWTAEELSLMQEVAVRTWEAVVRARAEQALRESEERFRLMADAIPQSIWITDAAGQTEFLNKHWCDYCGDPYAHTTAAAVAMKYVHPDDAPKLMGAFEKAMQNGEPFEVEQRNRSWKGEYRWFLNRANPYRDPVTGQIIKWFGVSVDIHDRKLAEQALRQSEEALERRVQERTLELEKANQELKRSNANLEEFAYAASHDLKEPIRKIHFFSDRLKERLHSKLEDEDRRCFERLEMGSRRMASLIDDLLQYSHVSRGISSAEAIDLMQTLSYVLDDLELHIVEKGASIAVDPLPAIKGHQRQLQQLFENLIGNALKYSKPDLAPQISITSTLVKGSDIASHNVAVSKNQMYHLIQVQDNGIGFDQQDAGRIFNVFTRLHGNSEYRGTGVGLSIVQKVVQNHNGYIWAESTPGEGATFKVLLPSEEHTEV